MITASVIKEKGEFLYHPNSKICIRNREDLSNDQRKIEMISPEELEYAILETVRLTYGGYEEDIIKEVGNSFGYSRITKNINDAIKIIIGKLIKKDRLDLNDGKLGIN